MAGSAGARRFTPVCFSFVSRYLLFAAESLFGVQRVRAIKKIHGEAPPGSPFKGGLWALDPSLAAFRRRRRPACVHARLGHGGHNRTRFFEGA